MAPHPFLVRLALTGVRLVGLVVEVRITVEKSVIVSVSSIVTGKISVSVVAEVKMENSVVEMKVVALNADVTVVVLVIAGTGYIVVQRLCTSGSADKGQKY